MTISRDQTSALATTSGATSLNIVWSTAPTAGATVVVFVFTANGTPSSVVDNGTTPSTLTADVSVTLAATAVTLLIYRANNITLPSAGSYTVTVNVTPSQTLVAGGLTYLGVKSGAPTQTNTNKASNNGPSSTGNATPNAGGALAFAAEFDELPSGNDNIVLTNASFTEQFTENSGTLITGGCADWINAGPSAANCTWTIASNATAWAGAIAVYDAAPAAGTSGQSQPRATVPIPRRRLVRGLSRGGSGQAFVAVPAPLQEFRLAPRRKLARAIWHGAIGSAYVFVPAPPQQPKPSPRRKLARAVVEFTPVVTTNAALTPGPAGTVPVLMANQTRKLSRRDGRVVRR